MDVTDVRVFPVNQDKLRAFVSIVLDRCFLIADIKIIHGNNGLFVSMPSKRRRDGTFRDVAHPLNHETRKMLEDRIIGEYRLKVGDGKKFRSLEEDPFEGGREMGAAYSG
ncbi:MAG: septation regulator SpoVG [Acidobacteriota bacterium]